MEDVVTQVLKVAEENFANSLGKDTDPAIVVLKGHLYSENMLENLILSELPRGDRIIENGGLTFHHKLTLVDSLDVIPDNLISTLRGINKLRNKFAHNLDAGVTSKEILKIGSPLGKEFTRLKHEAKDDHALLRNVIHYSCGLITRYSIDLEIAKNIQSAKPENH